MDRIHKPLLTVVTYGPPCVNPSVQSDSRVVGGLRTTVEGDAENRPNAKEQGIRPVKGVSSNIVIETQYSLFDLRRLQVQLLSFTGHFH